MDPAGVEWGGPLVDCKDVSGDCFSRTEESGPVPTWMLAHTSLGSKVSQLITVGMSQYLIEETSRQIHLL